MSLTAIATSSERRSPSANPTSSSARSRNPAFPEVSIRSTSSSSGSRSSAVFLFGAVPWTRAIPSSTVMTDGSAVGDAWPATRWARAIAAQRRLTVGTDRPASASAVRCNATAVGVAGML